VGHLPLDVALQLLEATCGGHSRAESRTQGCVEGTRWGKFKVEIDSAPLQARSYLKPLEYVGIEPDSAAAQFVEDSVLRVATEIVPLEIVTPPVPWNELEQLDPLWSALRSAGAEDTRASLLYAFGLHLNPEPPDLEVSTVLAHLQAFLLLEDWIAEATDIDLTRRVAPYIRSFPEEYRVKVLSEAYAPDWRGFVADYVAHNPTRNRSLDLAPLMAHASGEDLSARIEEWSLVKPRPTFHYRLPNSDLNQPGWSPARDWNRWVAVERLASSPALLGELAAAHLADFAGGESADAKRAWTAHIEERLSLTSGEPAMVHGS